MGTRCLLPGRTVAVCSQVGLPLSQQRWLVYYQGEYFAEFVRMEKKIDLNPTPYIALLVMTKMTRLTFDLSITFCG